MIYGYKRLSQDIKDVDAKQGIVTGYFSAFNIKDSDGDIIRPGSFKKSIDEWFPKGRIKHLLNHDPRQPLGKIMILKEDAYGLYYESKVGSHALGQDFIKMVESDLVKEHSIGYRIMNEKKSDEGNEITDIMLFEGSSLTSWGANEHTPLVGMKSLTDVPKRIKQLEKFVKNTDATDETIDLLLLEIKQLYQLIDDISSAPQIDEIAEQPKAQDDELKKAIQLLTFKHF